MSTARKRDVPGDRWMSLHAAAQMLGVTRYEVLQRAARNELESDYVAGRTVISRASVERARGAA